MVFADVVEVDGESGDNNSLVEIFDVGLSVNAGLSLSTDTTSSRSLICNVKCLENFVWPIIRLLQKLCTASCLTNT